MYLNNQCDNTCYHDDKGKEVTISHVHKHHPFPQDSERVGARPPAARANILFYSAPAVSAGVEFYEKTKRYYCEIS